VAFKCICNDLELPALHLKHNTKDQAKVPVIEILYLLFLVKCAKQFCQF